MEEKNEIWKMPKMSKNPLEMEFTCELLGEKTWAEIYEEFKMIDVQRFSNKMLLLCAYYPGDYSAHRMTFGELLHIANDGMTTFEQHAKEYNSEEKVREAAGKICSVLLCDVAFVSMVMVLLLDKAEDKYAAFCELTKVMTDTFARKNHDYGNSFDQSLDKFGLVAAACRMGDKMNRIKSLTKDEALVKDESIRDTLLDLANYAVMTVIWVEKIEAKEVNNG